VIARYVGGQRVTDPDVIDQMRQAIERGRKHTLSLTRQDFLYDVETGELSIDGMPAAEWINDMTEDEEPHVDYPHHPGTLYDCPACHMPD
jgi:hypothetical protein